MRPLEILVVIALALTLLAMLARPLRGSRAAQVLVWLSVGLTVLQLLVEGYRWQMVPAYACVAIVGLLAARRQLKGLYGTLQSGARGIRAGVAGLLAVALTCLLGTGFPIFSYPAPMGPYDVGTSRLYLVDRARDDPFAPVPHSPRELPAIVWYPADVPKGATRDPFWPPDAQIGQSLGLPEFLFSHMHLIKAYSVASAPLARAQRRYPVIIFSHGYLSSMWQNVRQMEEWASHGFVVVSLGHTYDASPLTFPDGRLIAGNSNTRIPPLSREQFAQLMSMEAQVDAAVNDPPAARRLWRDCLAFAQQTNWVIAASSPVWVQDTRFLIDQLAAIDAGTARDVAGAIQPFAGRLDLDRLGVAGMSFGGSTAGSVCASDNRCKAGLNFDGAQFGDVIDHPLEVPFMYFSNEIAGGQVAAYYGSKADLYGVRVHRSAHANFSDLSVAAPLLRWFATKKIAYLRQIDGEEMERIMSAYSVAFFQKYLQGASPPMLTSAPSPAEFPDVEYRWRLASAGRE